MAYGGKGVTSGDDGMNSETDRTAGAPDAWISTLDGGDEAVSVVDFEGRILQCNEAFRRRSESGFDPVGRRCCEYAAGCNLPPAECPLKRMIRSLRSESADLFVGGRWHRCTVQPLVRADGEVASAVCALRDVTDERMQQERTERLAQLQAAVGDPTATLFRAKSVPEIFTRVCELAVSQGGFRIAWAGIVNPDSLEWTPVAEASGGEGFLAMLKTWSASEKSTCPALQRALDTATPVFVNELDTAEDLASFREEFARREVQSLGVLPLKNQDRIEGILSLYSGQRAFFTPAVTAQLAQLAANISLAMDMADRDEQRRQAEAALVRSEQRLRSLLQFASDLLVVLDREGGVEFASPSLPGLLGYRHDEVVGHSIFEFVHPEDAEILRTAWRMTLEDPDDPTPHEFRIRHRNKSWRILQTSGSRVMPDDPSGSIIVNARDITEKRASDHMLRLLSSALQNAANGVVITDRQGTIQWVNAAFSSLTGYAASEVLGQNPRVLKSGAHPLSFYEDLWRAILAGEVWRSELVNRRKDGTFYNEEMTITPVPDNFGRVTHFVAIKQDITNRKRAEDRIREQAALLQMAPQAIVVRDLQDRVVFWNHGAAVSFGVEAGEAIGRQARDVLPFNDPTAMQTALDAVRNTGLWQGELTATIAGQRHHFACNWTLIQDENGSPKSILCVDTNVTEKHRVEEYLAQSQRLDSLGTLVSGIAHDFNNILMPILGLSDMLLTMPGSMEDTQDALRNINSAARDAREIVRRLREFYRPSESSVVQPIEAQRLIEDALLLTQPRWKTQAEAEGRPIEVRTAARGNPVLLANESQMREALTNLIFNAVDAMPQGGVLSIEASQTDGFIFLEVGDTGTGMTEEVQRRCLEPFFTTKGASGSGLGLSMCHGIVQRHMGSLHIQSGPGGTVVRMRFPATAATGGEPMLTEVGPNTTHGDGARVLVVDDEEMSRRLLGDYLTADGYVVDTASGAREAIRKLKDARFNLLITDRAMPHMSGDLLAMEARRLAPDMPILMVTGFGDLMLTGNGAPPGVDAIAAKPLSRKELCAVAHDLLRRVNPR